MRQVLVGIVLIVATVGVGCTKKNPNLCCTDAADCEAQGLPDDAQCGEGLVCRGNQCIAEVCSTSNDCDAAAPYCLLDQGGRCAEACTADTQCPGSGQDPSEVFCVGGTCVACRQDMNDCSMDAPVCDMGGCRVCRENAECPSGACASDGTCVAESDIAFVAPSGSPASSCTRLSPCTLSAAITLSPSRSIIELTSGLYTTSADTHLSGIRRLIGSDGARPQVTRSTPGAVFLIDENSDVSFEHLEVFGAVNSVAGVDDGRAISCPHINQGVGSRTVRLDDNNLHDNVFAGLASESCTIFAARTVFESNGQGADVSDGNGTFDRCLFAGNTTRALELDGGVFSVTNTFVTRNSAAMEVFVEQPGTHFDFVTVVDNGTGIHISGDNTDHVTTVRVGNSIIARNTGAQLVNDATSLFMTTGSIIANDATGLNFMSPDVAPFDYHLTSGSAAIDAADPTVTSDHDFDGDLRPLGKAMDVGADELK